jgi:hypothetical protein
MSWLRLDDGFSDHPKLLELSPADRWTWIEVLCYCARYRTGGHVPRRLSSKISRATPAFVDRCFKLELLDEDPDGELHVHDWKDYNGPLEAATLAKKRNRMRAAGVDEAIVREVAPYSEDIDFERVSRQLSPQNRARIHEADLAGAYRESETDSALVEGLPPFGDILGDVTPDVTPDIRFTRAVSPTPTPTPRDTNPLTEQQLVHAREKRARSGYVDNLSQYTGARIVRGEVGITHVYDPLGTEPTPADWPHSRPTREEIIRAFRERGE